MSLPWAPAPFCRNQDSGCQGKPGLHRPSLDYTANSWRQRQGRREAAVEAWLVGGTQFPSLVVTWTPGASCNCCTNSHTNNNNNLFSISLDVYLLFCLCFFTKRLLRNAHTTPRGNNKKLIATLRLLPLPPLLPPQGHTSFLWVTPAPHSLPHSQFCSPRPSFSSPAEEISP